MRKAIVDLHSQLESRCNGEQRNNDKEKLTPILKKKDRRRPQYSQQRVEERIRSHNKKQIHGERLMIEN